jgi:hypothetical protein
VAAGNAEAALWCHGPEDAGQAPLRPPLHGAARRERKVLFLDATGLSTPPDSPT